MPKKKEATQVTLGPYDGALIMRQKGGFNLMLPQYQDEEIVPEDMILLSGIAAALGNKDERLYKVVADIMMESKAVKDAVREGRPRKKAASKPKARAPQSLNRP